MKLLLCFLIVSSSCYSQDTIRLKHKNYTSVYSKSLRYPILVEWWETKSNTSCQFQLGRKDSFTPDPLLRNETNVNSYYVGSGLDRGHMTPSASNECNGIQTLNECFYFSNIAPQHHVLNAGDWFQLEDLTRKIAQDKDSVHIWAGSIGVSKKIGAVSVPVKCWKVFYVVKTKRYYAYIFNNSADKQTGVKAHKVNKSDLEKLIKLKIQ